MTQAAAVENKKTKKRRFTFKRHYFAFPYFFLSGLFIVIPLIILFVYAFRGADGGFTFSNFASFFTTPHVLRAMGNSLLIGFATTALCLALAYPVALILANSRFNKTMILVLMFVLPMYINSLLRTLAIKSLFDIMGIENNFWRITIAHVYDFFPFMLLPIYTVLVNMDKSYLEASNDLGGNTLKTWARVTLPLSVPGIVSGILMVFMPTVSMFAVRDIVINREEWPMFGNIIDGMFRTESMYGLGSAYAMILLVMVMVTMVVAGRVNAKRQREVQGK
ncbi:MAG: ABC transporter permease [Firmicutes bacterium]|nr:ABC transporter permease [Bacillota bacterium]